jgi:hypothetical protein
MGRSLSWWKVIVAGVAVAVAGIVIVTLIVTGYAFHLAFEARGAPDQTRIGNFAKDLGESPWTLLTVLLAIPAVLWAAKKAPQSAVLCGLMVGGIAGAIGLGLSHPVSLRSAAEFVLVVGAGALGGFLSRWMAARRGTAT